MMAGHSRKKLCRKGLSTSRKSTLVSAPIILTHSYVEEDQEAVAGPQAPVVQQLSAPPDQSPKMGGLKGSGLKQPFPPPPPAPAKPAQFQAPPTPPPAPPVPPPHQPDLKQGEALVMGQKVNYEAMTKEKG